MENKVNVRKTEQRSGGEKTMKMEHRNEIAALYFAMPCECSKTEPEFS
jgi:hypothetical protein